ncbi:hydroxyacylglutathione hydrolase [methanotrophic endosymbiont of Bathymodiolus puteoserpentis (Logatchev)]|jgi:hydroxyacylglutathione hydrolase|uniref:hydroxyacylglutathione hydrolase n=1 Tax=methanotrophic endosymbiont of Bathymodiolus puteoserpentis (Logatchev) TaxID=343235 RepID=UPI0013CDCEA7|nr:hydroxyacylglutathione hydrolase [methanotrophic endosymbiont of Bathymodiolus puteoserpentis (Logatchev)]SHE23152.1 Hydroxyacylglutathione hydrolase [methanotrophic endosymbiont of Bathymodiolus puteoserpentis (Logatchev)]
MLQIQQIPVLKDNYIYLIHDAKSRETAVVDPAIAEPVLDVLKQNGWNLTYILNTHHHADHVGGNLSLKQQTNCQIIGSINDQQRIPGITTKVNEADTLKLGENPIQVINCSGHTTGHIAFYMPTANALFCGDTLFAMGCGRLFEGTADQMQQSLKKFTTLPLDTKIYCAHEYTAANAQFALSVEPENKDLLATIKRVKQLRASKQPTVPTTLTQELATNPFLRTNSPEIQKTLTMQGASELAIFTELRERKNRF